MKPSKKQKQLMKELGINPNKGGSLLKGTQTHKSEKDYNRQKFKNWQKNIDTGK